MVGGFFPAPYPDECLYSILCRYYVYSGSTSFGITARELFGNEQNVTSSIYLPIKIEYVDNWTSPSSGISRKTIAENHTLHPYWSITYPSDFRAETDEILNGGTITTKFNRFGTFKSRRSWSKYLKYCPVCANEDMNMYGETYWRRQHQISEMIYCTNHKVRLLNSEVPVKRTATGFYPATSEINANSDVDVPDNLLRHKEKFLKIGQESEWLIKYGLEVDWSVNGYEKYWKSLRDKGLASFQGRCDYLELESALSDYWGADFLKILFDMTDESHFERIKQLAALTYTDENGEITPILTEDNMEALNIRRGTLTVKELNIMREHASVTSRLLGEMKFNDYYKDVKHWAESHHEFLNGAGYPNKLTGSELTPEICILTIMDIYEALTARDRPYKRVTPVDRALNILLSDASEGKLHKELVELFIESKVWENVK